MKLVIDHLIDITDWTVNAPSTIEEISVRQMIAGLNDKSLLIKFDSADTVRTAVKTFSTPIDVTDYETLVFSIWSQKYKSTADAYRKAGDFAYKIKLNATQEFYIPIWQTFSDIQIGIEEVTSIDRIEITPIHAETDYIIISEMIAEKEELPYDILIAIQETIDYYMNLEVSDGINVGTISGTAGDITITLDSPPYLDKYTVVKIVEGVNSEIHQIDENDGETWRFNSNYDGKTLVNTYTNATVYLQYPTYINPVEREIMLPGIAIWGFEPEPFLRGAKLDTNYDTFSVDQDNFKVRTEGELYRLSVKIDLESRQYELIDTMAKVVRKILAGEILWVNGRFHDIWFDNPPVEQRPISGIEVIPKVQYSLTIEVRENINDRITLPKVVTTNLDVIIGGQNG